MIISSQHYLDLDIVDAKEQMLVASGVTSVTVPCSYVGNIDGEEYAIVVDKHHTMAAARRLGIDINYDIEDDSEGLTGDALLNARCIDGDYYDVAASDPEDGMYYLVW